MTRSETENNNTTNANEDHREGSNNSSYRSSSSEIKYKSSSAESVRPRESDRNDKYSQSPSRSRSQSRSWTRSRSWSRSRTPLRRFPKRRPNSRGNFRRNNFRRERFDGYDRGKRRFHPRGGYSNHRPLVDRMPPISEKRFDDGSNNGKFCSKLPNLLKPSDIKNNAKKNAKSFLEMLEEKRIEASAFTTPVVPFPSGKKQIHVKIHKFVNTFNSLNVKKEQVNGEQNESMNSDEFSNKTLKKRKADDADNESSNSDSNDSSRNLKGKFLNSSKEEGEIRSDGEDKPKKKSKNRKKSKGNDEEKYKKNKKKKKGSKKSKKKKAKRKSSSSDSSDTSSSSSSSDLSSYSDSDSESDSSEDSSSSSDSSESSDQRKKKKSKKKIKHKQTKKSKSSKKHKESKKKHKKIKKIVETVDTNSENETLEDITKEWPKELLLHTKTEPSIQFSINPLYSNEFSSIFGKFEIGMKSDEKNLDDLDNKSLILKQSTPNMYIEETLKANENTNDTKPKLPFIGKMKGLNKKKNIKSISNYPIEPMKLDMNYDYNYYYQYYYANGFPYMDHNDQHIAASYNAYYHMFNSYDYNQQQLAKWASQQGFNLIETNKYDQTIVKSENSFTNKTDESSTQGNSVTNQNEAQESNSGGENILEIKKEEEEECSNTKEDFQKIQVITTNHISSSISGDFITHPKMCHLNDTDSATTLEPRLNSPPLSPPPPRPKMTVLETTEPMTLPNGVTLPAGTKQIIVHPYNRPVY